MVTLKEAGANRLPMSNTRAVRRRCRRPSAAPSPPRVDVLVVTHSVPDGCPRPSPSITVDGTKLPPTDASVRLIVP